MTYRGADPKGQPRVPRAVRRESLGLIEADEPHRVLPPAPARGREPPPTPAGGPVDAYALVRAWSKARLNRDWANAARLLAELERLATRPRRKAAGGERDGLH